MPNIFATVAALSISYSGSASADPFEDSNALCLSDPERFLCTANPSSEELAGDVAEVFHLTFEEFLALNPSWVGLVDEYTPIPVMSFYVFSVGTGNM